MQSGVNGVHGANAQHLVVVVSEDAVGAQLEKQMLAASPLQATRTSMSCAMLLFPAPTQWIVNLAIGAHGAQKIAVPCAMDTVSTAGG